MCQVDRTEGRALQAVYMSSFSLNGEAWRSHGFLFQSLGQIQLSSFDGSLPSFLVSLFPQHESLPGGNTSHVPPLSFTAFLAQPMVATLKIKHLFLNLLLKSGTGMNFLKNQGMASLCIRILQEQWQYIFCYSRNPKYSEEHVIQPLENGNESPSRASRQWGNSENISQKEIHKRLKLWQNKNKTQRPKQSHLYIHRL